MEEKRGRMSQSLFTTQSQNPVKSPRNFEKEVVGLGIVAAMTDLSDELNMVSPTSRSTPIPILLTCAKATANFRSALNFNFNLEREKFNDDELDDEESYTCVISHVGNNLINKRVYFGDHCSTVFDTLPLSEVKTEFLSDTFLTSCHLCNKLLHGLDIFMYRGEKAFCSWECRDKQIRSDDCKEKCGSAARKQLNYSVSPCSGPLVFLAGVAAA